MQTPGKRRRSPSLAIEVVALLIDDGPQTFGALRAHLAVAPSVAARLLARLTDDGWVARHDAGWAAGPACARLQPRGGLRRRLQDELDRLREASGCTALLLGLDGYSEPAAVCCLAKSSHEDGLLMQPVGARRGHWLGHAWSWCFLADLPASERARRLAADPGVEFLAQWRRAQRALAGGGVVAQRGPTFLRLAIAVRGGDGRLLAALGLGLPGADPPAKQRSRAGSALLRAAPRFASLLPAPASADMLPES